MSKYHIFVIVVYPVALLVVTAMWLVERPKYTWREMYQNMWRAS